MVILTSSQPMAKCRVLYIGSAVPLETATGLEAIQKPLSERFPVDDDSRIEGIDAYVSVTNRYIQQQYITDPDQLVQFPISSLTMCAAVRCISTVNGATGETSSKFVSLNDPAAGGENSHRPAIFTTVTRRTQGRKILECHGYICQSAKDALQLVKFASIAGKNFKQNEGQHTVSTPVVNGTAKMNGNASPAVVRANVDTIPTAFNRLSVNSNTVTNGNAMRLIPGEPVSKIVAGPEFYEPVSAQGYFYSSNKTEVKKFNIEKLGGRHDDRASEIASEMPMASPRMVNGMDIPPAPPSEPLIPTAQPFAPQPPPIFIPFRGPTVVGRPAPPPPFAHPPMFFRPPPPPPPHMHPMMMRPRFFSPPPPRMRPQPFFVPPGAPPPMMAAPIYIRRPRRASKSSSRSRSSSRSGDSRSRSPKPAQNGFEHTVPKVPNGDADSSSDESRIRPRANTPPTDYNNRQRPTRQSRREVYEVKYGVAPPLPSREENEPPRRPHDYYVYPPSNGGYTPFSMYNPHGRSRSVPPHARHRSKSPGKRAKGKKHKKQKVKKNKPKKHHHSRYPQQSNGAPNGLYPREPEPQYSRYPAAPRSNVSTESNRGYHSEVPNRSNVDTSGYEFYPPRDFRKSGKQFMNERGFGESIRNDPLLSRSTRPVPSAYELSDGNQQPPSLRGTRRNEDVDFNMY